MRPTLVRSTGQARWRFQDLKATRVIRNWHFQLLLPPRTLLARCVDGQEANSREILILIPKASLKLNPTEGAKAAVWSEVELCRTAKNASVLVKHIRRTPNLTHEIGEALIIEVQHMG